MSGKREPRPSKRDPKTVSGQERLHQRGPQREAEEEDLPTVYSGLVVALKMEEEEERRSPSDFKPSRRAEPAEEGRTSGRGGRHRPEPSLPHQECLSWVISTLSG